MEEEKQISGVKKAAILMVLLGDETSASLFRYLEEEEVQEITKEIARLGQINQDTADSVLDDYYKMTLARSYLMQGGADYARKLLVKAFGEITSRKLLDRVTLTLQSGSAGFGSLEKADPAQLSKFIQKENPQTIALVLAHLKANQAAALLNSLPAELRGEVVMRMASLEQISPEIIAKINTVLSQRLESMGDFSRETYGGIRAVAELINKLDSNTSGAILEKIESNNPNLALSIRNLMFVFDDILLIDDAGMREVIQGIDKKTLTVALKGTSEELRKQFYRHMSQRAVEMLKEDMEVLGAVKIKDVEAAQQEIVAVIRKLDQDGTISLRGGGSEEYVN
jgi:flagellar motor switch protein FliG